MILVLFCNERDLALSISGNYQAEVIEAFNSILRYLDGSLKIDNLSFVEVDKSDISNRTSGNKTNSFIPKPSSFFYTKVLFLDLSITNGIVSI